ncbi:MAG: hypothetical protein JXB50_14360 [Spirochaetes bacterium]|nr:hypothetical protein [Spirochaetota bacterium]
MKYLNEIHRREFVKNNFDEIFNKPENSELLKKLAFSIEQYQQMEAFRMDDGQTLDQSDTVVANKEKKDYSNPENNEFI